LYEFKFLINALLLLGGLLFVYYLVNKYGLYSPNRKGGKLKVLERYPLSGESGLIVFKFNGKTFLAFYGKENFKVISEKEDVEESTPNLPCPNSSSGRNY
jgi:hypothetical protein